jgi:hypothetical protein
MQNLTMPSQFLPIECFAETNLKMLDQNGSCYLDGLTQRTEAVSMNDNQTSFEYDVAISFAGEDRSHAEQIAGLLKSRQVRVFYDMYEQATLWGKDLYAHLNDVYGKKARYCVMLLSSHYAHKLWTNHERQSAQARAFQQQEEYILPVKLDDTSIPGIHPTTGYIDLRQVTVERLAELLLKKLYGKEALQLPAEKDERRASKYPVTTTVPVPRIKQTFSDHDRDRFRKVAFSQIRDYFEDGLSVLEAHHQGITTDFASIHAFKFASSIYLRGELKSECMVWVGGSFQANAINYFQGLHIDITNEGRMNDYITVDSDDEILGFRVSNMWHGGGNNSTSTLLTVEQAAEYLWRRFTEALG